VCHVCHKRRQLVLSSGLWHPGCDVDEDVPLAREVDRRLKELDVSTCICMSSNYTLLLLFDTYWHTNASGQSIYQYKVYLITYSITKVRIT